MFVRNGLRETCSVVLLAQGTCLVLGFNRPHGEEWVSWRKGHYVSTVRFWGIVIGGLWGNPCLEHHRISLPLGLGMQNRRSTAMTQAGSWNKGNEPVSQAWARLDGGSKEQGL